MLSAKLSTMQRNVLCRLFGRKEFTPEEVSRLDYAEVERQPKIGKKGIEIIRVWLRQYGYDLNNLPEGNHDVAERRLRHRLQHAARLLVRHGYRVESPQERAPD